MSQNQTLWLGQTGLVAVALIAAVNGYAIVPTLAGLDLLVGVVGVAVGAYVWVMFLKVLYIIVFGNPRQRLFDKSDSA